MMIIKIRKDGHILRWDVTYKLVATLPHITHILVLEHMMKTAAYQVAAMSEKMECS